MCCVFIQGGWTALHVAAKGNSVEVVNLLLMKDSTLIKQTDCVSEQVFFMFKEVQYYITIRLR